MLESRWYDRIIPYFISYMRNKLAIKRTAIPGRSASTTAAAIHHVAPTKAYGLMFMLFRNVPASVVGQMKNYSPTTCQCSDIRRTRSGRDGEGSAEAKETSSSPHKGTRRLIYDRNDRTDARKLRVVSHNLGIRSPSTSRSAIVVSVVACSDPAARMTIIYKAICARRSRDARKLHL